MKTCVRAEESCGTASFLTTGAAFLAAVDPVAALQPAASNDVPQEVSQQEEEVAKVDAQDIAEVLMLVAEKKAIEQRVQSVKEELEKRSPGLDKEKAQEIMERMKRNAAAIGDKVVGKDNDAADTDEKLTKVVSEISSDASTLVSNVLRPPLPENATHEQLLEYTQCQRLEDDLARLSNQEIQMSQMLRHSIANMPENTLETLAALTKHDPELSKQFEDLKSGLQWMRSLQNMLKNLNSAKKSEEAESDEKSSEKAPEQA